MMNLLACAMVKLTAEDCARTGYGDHLSVCELGNQHLREEVKRKYKTRDVKKFYQRHNFTKYFAIDTNESCYSIPMDLNYNIKTKYNFNEQFDLVTNNGTGEHVFNQLSMFENMHDLCKLNGYMIHVLPFNSPEHGFYNFNPNLFGALALQNNYEIIKSVIAKSDMSYYQPIEFTPKRQTGIVEKWNIPTNDYYSAECAVIMKKKSDEKFSIPMQEMYVNNIRSAEIRENYK